MKFCSVKPVIAAALGVLAFQPHPLFACAACYGASDSPMAKGMNWGIVSLLGVVAVVLGSIASFFVFIGKRSAAMNSPESPTPQQPETTQSKKV
ncbi:MAG TPA: hypothetical protein VKV04_10545 [Verrucomicrobiae bacterium]|jgi:hypothetical protein|nr:hypothetical protein [Verrucomicrobiae bacterium]